MAIRDNVSGGALTETTFLILLAVYCQPRHGYGIMQFIEKETEGRVSLGAGTLYGALNTLVKKEWLKQIEGTTLRYKKEYLISKPGKQIVRNEIQRLLEVYTLALNITEGEDK